jgi:hypothetical protein
VGSQQHFFALRRPNKPASASTTAKLITMTKAVNTINIRFIINPSSWEKLDIAVGTFPMRRINSLDRQSCF